MKSAAVLAALLFATANALAQNAAGPPLQQAWPPLPRPRPPDIPPLAAPPQSDAASAEPSISAAMPPPPSACDLRLSKIAAYQPLPALVGPGECGADDAVLLTAVLLADNTKVAVAPPATLRCTMAEAVAHWVRDDVAPAAVRLGGALRGLDNFDSYECRGRNRIPGAKLSEHGRADALDVRDFKLADGRVVGLTDVNVATDWREAMRASACARFSTVLGPGSDGEHEEHIHLDLAERRNNFKICEWDIREPFAQPQQGAPLPAEGASPGAVPSAVLPGDDVPMPRPRPTAAATDYQSGASSRKSEHN